MNKEKRLEEMDSELDVIFDELKETFKKLVFKSMIYRDLHLENVTDKLQESFDKLDPETKKKLQWVREKSMMMNTELGGIKRLRN